MKFPIIHLTTDSLNTKKIVILQQVEAVTVVSTSSMGKNAELKEINVNSDRSQVSSICKKQVKERIRLLVHLCAVSIRPPPRLLELMLLIT